MTDIFTQARNLVATLPAAVAGQRGHGATFRAAATLVHGFALSEADAMPILREYSARCLPPWSAKELEHKLKSASEWDKYDKPRGYLVRAAATRRRASKRRYHHHGSSRRPSSQSKPPRRPSRGESISPP